MGHLHRHKLVQQAKLRDELVAQGMPLDVAKQTARAARALALDTGQPVVVVPSRARPAAKKRSTPRAKKAKKTAASK
jgi:hypothetical protein